MTNTALQDVEMMVRTIAQTAVDNEKYFCDLDAVVGDGDFGYSLARGFEKLLEDWDSIDRSDAGTFLKRVGVTITSRIGGTSGPIWGTAFMRAGATIGDAQELNSDRVTESLRAAIAGIKQRGQADLGDKTLLDALVPAVDALEEALKSGADGSTALERAAVVARERAEATRELEAKRGRASYSGERSTGSLDAGAVAVAVMLERITEAWTSNRTTPTGTL